MAFLKLFISSLICVFALDMLWLGVIANNLYKQQIGGLLATSGGAMAPNWPTAVVVYLFIVMGILCFVVPRAQGDNLHGLVWGVLFGAVVYGVYDFTNFSILANWPLKITLIDFAWGMTLCGLTSLFAVFIQNWLHKA